MGFLIFDYDEEILGLYLEVFLVSSSKKSFVELLTTNKRLVFIERGKISVIWHCDIISCDFFTNKCFIFGNFIKLKCKNGGFIIYSKESPLIYNNIMYHFNHASGKITTPGIAQIIAKHREMDVKPFNNFMFISEIGELKKKVDEIISVSDKITPILSPINCTLDEIISIVSNKSIDNLSEFVNQTKNLTERPLLDSLYDILDLITRDTGAILLIDLYCVVNKCNLGHITPAQLLDIATNIGRNYKLADLSNDKSKRILAIVNNSSKERLLETIKSIGEFSAGISANQYSMICGISAMLAEYQLSIAESSGFVVRDQSLQGIRYYITPNST